MIRTLLIEDEKANLQNLIFLLEQHCPEVEIVGTAADVTSGVDTILKHRPELIFLDIQLKTGTAFDILNHFDHPDFEVIFVTAYDHYAIRAIRISALDYLLKPVDPEELITAVHKMKEKKKGQIASQLENMFQILKSTQEEPKIALSSFDRIELIPLRKIIRCEGDNNYTHFILNNGKKITITKTLKEYEQILEPLGFIRTHQSHLVNLHHITSYVKKEGGYLLLSNQDQIPISKVRKPGVLPKIMELGV